MNYSRHLIPRPACTTIALLLCLSLGQAAPGPRSVDAVFYPEKLAEMDAAVNEAILAGKCPGGVLWLEHNGVAYHKAYGNRAVVPAVEPMTEDTIFDAASLTKVVACTPAIILIGICFLRALPY